MTDRTYPEEDMIKIEEAADFLDVSTKTIRQYIRSGKLHAKKKREAWLISVSELKVLKDSPEDDSEAGGTAKPGRNIEAWLGNISDSINQLKTQMIEVDRRLFLISREREAMYNRPETVKREHSLERLKAENAKLAEELQQAKKENIQLRQNGPKDSQILKNKNEEVEALKATVASNQRGLSLLRDEVEQYKEDVRRRDASIRELKNKTVELEEELSEYRSAKKLGFLKTKKPGGKPDFNTTGTP